MKIFDAACPLVCEIHQNSRIGRTSITRLSMSILVLANSIASSLGLEVDYVEAADQLLGFRERPIDPQDACRR